MLAALTVAAALLNAFATLPLLGLAAFLSGFSFGGFQVQSGSELYVRPLSLHESKGAWLQQLALYFAWMGRLSFLPLC